MASSGLWYQSASAIRSFFLFAILKRGADYVVFEACNRRPLDHREFLLFAPSQQEL